MNFGFMLQLIAFIIFAVSLLGIAFILLKKIPALAALPQNGHHGIKKNEFVLNIEKKIKDFHFKFFHKQVFLHKILSFIKVWVLRIETKIDVRLHGIRKKAQEIEKQIKKKK